MDVLRNKHELSDYQMCVSGMSTLKNMIIIIIIINEKDNLWLTESISWIITPGLTHDTHDNAAYVYDKYPDMQHLSVGLSKKRMERAVTLEWPHPFTSWTILSSLESSM